MQAQEHGRLLLVRLDPATYQWSRWDEDRQVAFALTATDSRVDIDPAPLTVRGVITCEAVTES